MKNLRVSLIQFDPKWNAVSENLQSLEKLFSEYEGKTDLVVLPEMFSTGFNINPDRKLIEEQSKIPDWMENVARWSGFALCGSVVRESEGKLYNNMLMYSPEGEKFEHYKRHLFSFGRETEVFSAGSDRSDWLYKGWQIRPAICYDLRFPVWLRNDSDYDVLLLCANWPKERIHHWKMLLQARSIENLSYVIGCNRVGKEPSGLNYSGESNIFKFDGSSLLSLKDEMASKTVNLSIDELKAYRNEFKFLDDRDEFSIIKNNTGL